MESKNLVSMDVLLYGLWVRSIRGCNAHMAYVRAYMGEFYLKEVRKRKKTKKRNPLSRQASKRISNIAHANYSMHKEEWANANHFKEIAPTKL